jgi:hypothetical protein
MVRVAGVEPAWTCPHDTWVAATLHPECGEGFSALSCLTLHADHLAQRVHHVQQIALRLHHGVDGPVRHRRFVDDVHVLTAFDAGRCFRVVFQREAALRIGAVSRNPPDPPFATPADSGTGNDNIHFPPVMKKGLVSYFGADAAASTAKTTRFSTSKLST